MLIKIENSTNYWYVNEIDLESEIYFSTCKVCLNYTKDSNCMECVKCLKGDKFQFKKAQIKEKVEI